MKFRDGGQMKNKINKLKCVIVTTVMACMLLTMINVSSHAQTEISLYGEELIEDRTDLD